MEITQLWVIIIWEIKICLIKQNVYYFYVIFARRLRLLSCRIMLFSKGSRDGIRSTHKKLQEHHYVRIDKVRVGDKGYFEYNYLIYEIPLFIDL